MSKPIITHERQPATYEYVETSYTYEGLLSLFGEDGNVVRPLVLRCQQYEAEIKQLAEQTQTLFDELTAAKDSLLLQKHDAVKERQRHKFAIDEHVAEIAKVRNEMATQRDNSRQVNDDLRREITALHREYQGQVGILNENLKIAAEQASYECVADEWQEKFLRTDEKLEQAREALAAKEKECERLHRVLFGSTKQALRGEAGGGSNYASKLEAMGNT